MTKDPQGPCSIADLKSLYFTLLTEEFQVPEGRSDMPMRCLHVNIEHDLPAHLRLQISSLCFWEWLQNNVF